MDLSYQGGRPKGPPLIWPMEAGRPGGRKALKLFFQNKTEKEFTSNKEVIKSINTILYVISHMESELSDSCRYESEDKWESFHL